MVYDYELLIIEYKFEVHCVCADLDVTRWAQKSAEHADSLAEGWQIISTIVTHLNLIKLFSTRPVHYLWRYTVFGVHTKGAQV